jgi:hypothetical protein
MKKGCLITTAILILSFVVCFVYFFQTGSLPENTPPTYITETGLVGKYSIEFYYVKSSLSANCIQVRKKIQKLRDSSNDTGYNGHIYRETLEEYILENYEHYDNMIGYCLRGDSLSIFLRKGYNCCADSFDSIQCDTFQLNINDVKYKVKE